MSKDLILTLLNQGKRGLVNTFNAVPNDKVTWKPLDNGRHALDLLAEAAQTCNIASKLVASRGAEKPVPEMFRQMAQERAGWSKEEALAQLETNFEALVAALEEAPEEELARPVTMSLGGGTTMPLAGWVMMAYRTFISRYAQINYIQTLYGDFEMH